MSGVVQSVDQSHPSDDRLSAGHGDVAMDPMSFFPLPDPAASGFTLEQMWPREPSAARPHEERPAWMLAITPQPRD